jgi:hypothetical protein
MPPKKVNPTIEIETFAVKKRTYTRKKKEASTHTSVEEITEKIAELVLETPDPVPVKRISTPASVFVKWEEICWEDELGSAILIIECKVAIPFVGRNIVNIQYFTASAMNPVGALCLPHRVQMPGTDTSLPPPLPLEEVSRYAFSLHPQVIVRYEIHRHEGIISSPERERSPLSPGYHVSQFFYRDASCDQSARSAKTDASCDQSARSAKTDRVEPPAFVILYQGRYIQLPRLHLQGVFAELRSPTSSSSS